MRTILMFGSIIVVAALVLWTLFGIRRPLVEAKNDYKEPSKFKEEYAEDHSPETGLKHVEDEELKRKNQ